MNSNDFNLQFDELKKNAIESGTLEDCELLAQWLLEFDSKHSWNGEFFTIDKDHRMYPVYKQIDEDEYEIVGYEIR